MQLSRIASLAMGIGIALAPGQLTAQDVARGSRNLPVDHWAYEYIQRLRTRGMLANLNPLIQPYRRAAVARGLARLDPDTLSGPGAEWVRLLREEFWRELDRIEGREVVAWGVTLGAEAVASSGQRLDPLRPFGDEDAWPRTRGGAWIEQGPFAAEARAMFDKRLEDDPEGPVDQARIGRVDNAYLSLAFPIGDVWFGRLKQNWSALGTTAVTLSAGAPAYTQLSYEIRVGPLALRSLIGELETIPSVTLGGLKRYVSIHRFEYRAERFVLAAGQSNLYATDKGFDLRFLNPFEGTLLEASTQRAAGNPDEDIVNQAVEALAWVGLEGVEGYFQFFLDDIDVTPGPEGAEPLTYAFHVGARFSNLAPWLELGVDYRQVSAFAYRPPQNDVDGDGTPDATVDQWSFLNHGLGDNFSDFDRFTLAADVFTPLRGLRLTPVIQVQRQGEGDFRDPLPPRQVHVQSPAIFLGQKETTVRLGLRGRYQPNRFIHVQWDLGTSFIDDLAHVPGASDTKLTGVVEAGFTIDWPIRR